MSNFYLAENLCKILDANVIDFDAENGNPDKTINTFLKTESAEGYYTLMNQCRIYLSVKRILFITDNRIYIIPFSKIIGYDVVDKAKGMNPIHSATTITTTTDTGNIIKRAIIGGLVAGEVGAIIGGATAKTTSKTDTVQDYANVLASSWPSLKNLELIIKFDDILSPIITIPFGNYEKELKEVVTTLDIIIKKNTEIIEEIDEKIIEHDSTIVKIGQDLGIAPFDPFKDLDKINDKIMSTDSQSEIGTPKWWIALLFCVAMILLFFLGTCS